MPTRRFSLAGVLAGSALCLLASCSDPAPQAPPPPEVTIITVQTEPVSTVVDLPGRVQAVRTAEVRARVDGIIRQRLYREGTDVKAGQPLFAIDPRQLTASANATQAALARARSAALNAQQDVDRYRPLLNDQAISKQEYDAAVATLGSARADVAQAEAQLETAKLNLDYASVTAPIAGRAGRAEVTEGALVNGASGTLLTTIEQLNPIYVNFSQSSSELLATRRAIASGRAHVPSIERIEVALEFEDGTTYPIAGHLNFLDLTINENTGTAALRAEFPNPAQLLLPGMFVRARIVTGTQAEGIVIPQRAVTVTSGGGTVMVLGKEDIVEQRPVVLGPLQGDGWVIRSGLKVGDRVVTSGLQKLRPGQPARVAKAAPTAAAPAAAATKR